MSPPIIFLSYSHQDERDKNRLVKQIKVVERTGGVDLWNDDRIRAGKDWRSEIDQAMERASVAILLITADFLTSTFILDVEVPELLKRHSQRGLAIFPVIARECPWEEVDWLARLNVRPWNGKPVWRSGGRYADRELANIAREIAGITKKVRKGPILRPDNPPASRTGTVHSSVADALDSMEGELHELESSKAPLTLSLLDAVISSAISYGAPLYNQGNIKACAEIYAHTVKRLLTLQESGDGINPLMAMETPPPKDSSMSNPKRRQGQVRNFGIEIAYGELRQLSGVSIVTTDANKAAWTMRHCFDQIHLMSRGIQAVDVAVSTLSKADERIDSWIRELTGLAISKGGMIYEVGLSRDLSWIRGCAAIYLHTAQTILAHLPTITFAADRHSRELLASMEAKLTAALAVGPPVTNETAYQACWDIRQAFERGLEKLG